MSAVMNRLPPAGNLQVAGDPDPSAINQDGNPFATPLRAEGGLSVGQLENILSDIRYQPLWRPEADKCVDYYDCHQLNYERLQRGEKLGIPPIITNLVGPAIDSVLGLEAKTRQDWRVTEEDETNMAPEQMMDALNEKLMEAERESRADKACSDAYAGQTKAGLGWVEVARATDAFAYPHRVQYVHRREIWWDWRAKQDDLSDARYLVRKRRFDVDELTALMPEHEDLITHATLDRFSTWQWETRDLWSSDLAYAANIERICNIDSHEWRDAARRRAMLFEVWYRQWIRGHVLRLPSGKAVPFDDQDARHRMAVEAGIIRPEPAVYANVRVAFYLGPHRLYDMATPYRHRHFPYVPFWGKREDQSGVPYGLIRAMISPQDVVNATDAKMHWMLNSRRVTLTSDALDETYNTVEQMQEGIARSDSVTVLAPNKPGAKFEVDTNQELNAQQFQRRQQAANDVNNASGIFKAFQGNETQAQSGVALSNQMEQSSVTLAEINDNYRFGRRQVGELLFCNVREELLNHEFDVAIKKGKKKTIVTMNKRVEDPATGELTIDNDVSKVPVKVVLEDTPSTPAYRQQQLAILKDSVKGLPPEYQAIAIPFLIELTDAPNKTSIADAMRKRAGVPDNLTEDEQVQADAAKEKAQQEAEAMAKAAAQAKIDRDAAAAAKDMAIAAKTKVDEVVGRVTAMYEAMQAAGVIAATPVTAPLGDKLLKSAGLDDKDAPPIVPDLPIGAANQVITTGHPVAVVPGNTNPSLPAPPPTGGEGAKAGIETPRIETPTKGANP